MIFVAVVLLFCAVAAILYHVYFVVGQPNPSSQVSTPVNPVSFGYDHGPVIENSLTCDLANLHPCKVSDRTSCFGCKDLTSSCQHFDTATKAKVNGQEFVVPANTAPDEGYCLPLTVFAPRCNPYHGDFVIGGVRDRYGLFCVCKDPGVVTNVDLNGPCETRANSVPYPFVDINVPRDQLELQCPAGTKAARSQTNVPSCLPLTVEDVGAYKLAAQPAEENFNKFLDKQTATTLTYNPCSFCLATGAPVAKSKLATLGLNHFACAGSSNALPIRRDPDVRLLRGPDGPDAVIKLPDSFILYQVVPSQFGTSEYSSFFVVTFEEMNGWDPWLVRTATVTDAETKNRDLWFYFFDASHQIRFPFSFNVNLAMAKIPDSIRHVAYNGLGGEFLGNSLEYCDPSNESKLTPAMYLVPNEVQGTGQVQMARYETYDKKFNRFGEVERLNRKLTSPNRVQDLYPAYYQAYRERPAWELPPTSWYAQKVDPKYVGPRIVPESFKLTKLTSVAWSFIPVAQMVQVGLVVGLWFKQPNDETLYTGYLDHKYSGPYADYWNGLPRFNPQS